MLHDMYKESKLVLLSQQGHIVVSVKVYLISMPRKESQQCYLAALTMLTSRELGLKMVLRYVFSGSFLVLPGYVFT